MSSVKNFVWTVGFVSTVEGFSGPSHGKFKAPGPGPVPEYESDAPVLPATTAAPTTIEFAGTMVPVTINSTSTVGDVRQAAAVAFGVSNPKSSPYVDDPRAQTVIHNTDCPSFKGEWYIQGHTYIYFVNDIFQFFILSWSLSL